MSLPSSTSAIRPFSPRTWMPGPGTPSAWAPRSRRRWGGYRRPGGDGWVLLVEHRSEETAEAARKSAAASLLGGGGVTLRGKSWWAVSRRLAGPGRAIVVVVRASSKELSETLLGEALRSVGGIR